MTFAEGSQGTTGRMEQWGVGRPSRSNIAPSRLDANFRERSDASVLCIGLGAAHDVEAHGVVLSDVLRADSDTLEGRHWWHHHTLSSPQGPQLLPLVPIPVRIDQGRTELLEDGHRAAATAEAA